MKKINVAKGLSTVEQWTSKHSPELLIGLGVTGLLSAIGLGIKVTPKAIKLIELEKERQNEELRNEAIENDTFSTAEVTCLSKKDTLRVVWKCYVPTVVTAAVSVGCIIGGSKTSLKRNAAIATAYKITETAFSDYKEEVVKSIGEKKEQVIKEKVAEKRVQKNPVKNKEVFITSNGEVLCFDTVFGRYFKSSKDAIDKAINAVNKNMIDDMYVSLNDFYYELGIPSTEIGERMGWNINDSSLLSVTYSSAIADNGEPCLAITYDIGPRYDYSKLY